VPEGSEPVIIFGWRVLWRSAGNGVFHCQRCRVDRQFSHMVGRRWFTLFFIPVIPLGQTGQHVRCLACGTRYRMEALNVPTSAQAQVALPTGMRAAAVAVLRAAGGGSELARRRAVDAIRASGQADYQLPALDADLSASFMSQQPGQDLARVLNALAAQLAVPAKEWFLAETVRIGLADGPLTDDERRMVHEIASQLGMTQAQAYGVISVTEQAARA
jgi:tellurite resistance protein